MARILVIDDDTVVTMLIRRVLEGAGYVVATADDGRKGVDLFYAEPFDLVITDIFMPDQEGLATIMELRRAYPDAKIIAMTGGGMRTVMDVLPVAEALGAVRSLRKPVAPPDLVKLVQELLPL